MIDVIKRNGNGQSQCIICASMHKYNIDWDNSCYSLKGYNLGYTGHAICKSCLNTIAKAFNTKINVINGNEKHNIKEVK